MSDTRNIEVEPTHDGAWFAGPAGRGRVTRLSQTTLRVDFEGHAYTEFFRVVHPIADQIIRNHGRVFFGIDAEGLRSYETKFRYAWTEWIKANLGAVDHVLVLYRSRVVQSGVVIVNAVTGTDLVELVRERDEFEDRLASAAARTPWASSER